MKNTKRKGFTIVELVIVIAVIAILAAVLIPTFASLINKANRSADIQAVHQMNTQLAIDEVDSNKTIVDVYAALEEGGMTAKDYKPLTSDTYFFWDADENRILYVDSDYKVQYPEEYKDTKTYNAQTSNWYSLSGEIKEEKVELGSAVTSVTVDSAEKLYYVIKNYESSSLSEIKLSGDINMMGAQIGFGQVTKKLTLTSADDNKKVVLSHWTQMKTARVATSTDSEGKVYDTGLIASVSGGAKVTVKNITIESATIGDLETGSVGALVGFVNNSGTATFEGCTIKDTIIYGKNKSGGMVGAIAGGGTMTIEGCSMSKVTVNCSEGESAMVIGCAYGNPSVTIDKNFSGWVEDCSLNLVNGKYTRDQIDISGKTLSVTISSTTKTLTANNAILVAELSSTKGKEGQQEEENGHKNYRMHIKNAYMIIQAQHESNATNIKINNTSKSDYDTYGTVISIDSTEYGTKVLYAVTD